jgi:hypothetical protein
MGKEVWFGEVNKVLEMDGEGQESWVLVGISFHFLQDEEVLETCFTTM